MKYDYDYLIVGSGFGGSVSALRLTEKGYSVGVMEMGRRWTPDNMPKTNWNIANFLWMPFVGLRGFLSMRFFKHVVIMHGNAVGGGSIGYAQTLLVPPDSVWADGSWKGLDNWEQVMPSHYATAKRMLGVVTNPIVGNADLMLKKMADAAGVGDTFYPTDVGVFFGKSGDRPGTAYPDPYFGGAGPDRKSCIGCGSCMVGCRHDAKNTLDKNYLYLAERNGAKVYAETRVLDVRPINGLADGSDGYEVTVARTFDSPKNKITYRARNVIFSASSLGTQELLFQLKQEGSLPNISEDLGNRVRTNSESLLSVRYPGSGIDMSKGIGIGSGIYVDKDTHIEAVRYPARSDMMSSLFTVLTDGRPGWSRPISWLGAILKLMLTNPIKGIRSLLPFGFAEQTVIFLCMQTVDGHINMRYKRRWFWPFKKMLVSEGDPIPTYIKSANDFARKGALATGGIAQSSMSEIFMNVPMTAHCMGGCAMADAPERGVIDAQNRVFNYKNMLVVDGAMLGANLGVNPSLTITALAERAMAFIPAAHKS